MNRVCSCVVAVLMVLLAAWSPAAPVFGSPPDSSATRPEAGPRFFSAELIPAPPLAATPTPASPRPVAPTSDVYTDTVYALQEERVIGEYTVRLWGDQNLDNWSAYFSGIVTVEGPPGTSTKIEEVTELDPWTGRDVTGDGTPDLVARTFTGGAHCCFSTIIYELGDHLVEALHSLPSNCDGAIKDLDGDGIVEFVTCDDSFAYRFCCFAGSPLPTVIMKYAPGKGYLPASPEFISAYDEDVARDLETAQTGAAADACEWDESNKCSVLPLILDYLYSGREDEAMAAVDRYYTADDAEAFKTEVLITVHASPLWLREP